MNDPWTLDWIFSEAGAGWVFGIVSLMASLVGFLLMQRSRKRSQRIVIREIGRTSLIRITERAREKIAVTFENRPVNKLAQLQVEIFNSGSEVIQDVALTICFQESTRVLDLSFEANPENLEVQTKPIGDNRVHMLIPFLNPMSQHKHRIVASIVCDGDVDQVSFIGGGVGWSVKPVLALSRQQRAEKRRVGFIALVLTSLAYAAYTLYMIAKWGVRPLGTGRDPSLNILSVYLPLLAFVLISGGIQLWLRTRSAWPFPNSKAN